jgi:hypothetical protein
MILLHFVKEQHFQAKYEYDLLVCLCILIIFCSLLTEISQFQVTEGSGVAGAMSHYYLSQL